MPRKPRRLWFLDNLTAGTTQSNEISPRGREKQCAESRGDEASGVYGGSSFNV